MDELTKYKCKTCNKEVKHGERYTGERDICMNCKRKRTEERCERLLKSIGIEVK